MLGSTSDVGPAAANSRARNVDAARDGDATAAGERAGELDAAVRPQQPEGDGDAIVRVEGSLALDHDRLQRRARGGDPGRLRQTEVGKDRLLHRRARALEPRDLEAALEVRVRVVLGEDLADRALPADLVAVAHALGADEECHSARLPPERRPVRLVEPAVAATRVDVVPVLVDDRVRDVRAASRGDDHHAAVPALAGVAARGVARAARGDLVPVDDPHRDALDLVAVRRLAQQVRVPLDVGVGANVEPDRPSLRVAEHDLARGGDARDRQRGEQDQHGDPELSCHGFRVGAACRRPHVVRVKRG